MAKIACKGDKLQLSIASVFTDIPQTKSIKGPAPKPQVADATALDSGVGFEKKPTGHSDGGTVSVSMFLDPANTVHKALLALAGAPAVSAWKRIFSDSGATVWPFSGVLTGVPAPSADVNGLLMADFEITLDGLPTYP